MDPGNGVLHRTARIVVRVSYRDVPAYDWDRLFRRNGLDDGHAAARVGHAEADDLRCSGPIPQSEAMGLAADRHLWHLDGGLQSRRILLQYVFSSEADSA